MVSRVSTLSPGQEPELHGLFKMLNGRLRRRHGGRCDLPTQELVRDFQGGANVQEYVTLSSCEINCPVGKSLDVEKRRDMPVEPGRIQHSRKVTR